MVPPFHQLIDLAVVRPLMHTFSRTSGLPMSLVDRDGKILACSGWQRVCTYFHRRYPASVQRCVESDTDFSSYIFKGRPPASGEHFESRCRNGLVHIGLPIIMENEIVATLFLSQFFYEPPDLEYFRKQAAVFGIEEEPYLKAVQEVPILSRTWVEEILGFYSGFAKLLEKLGTGQLRQMESRHRLEESERKFRSIFESALDSIVLVAADGRLLEANAQTSVNLGYSREELLRLTKYDIHAPDDRQRVADYIENVLREGSAKTEAIQQRKDGSFLPVEISGRRADLLGEPAVLCLTRDVSDRKKWEEGLTRALEQAEEAREKIDAILKSVPDGLLVTDLADRVVLMNNAAERLLERSFSPDRDTGRLLELNGLGDQIARTRELGEEQGPIEREVMTAGAGAIRVLQARSMPVRTAEGRLTGTITLLRDITREREIDQMKDDFISTAAHELRTPLTTIMGYLQLLLQQNQHLFSSEEQREFLQTAYGKSEVLAQIIEDLLDLSRIRSGHLITLKKSPEEMVALLLRAVTSFREMTATHTFILDLPDPPVYLTVDSGKIGQVLENLLSNAVKFSPSGGNITVRGRCMNGEFQVTVADEGIGMRQEQLARIFEKFWRADASTTASSGLGLGMSIVKSIVEAHSGRIWVESDLGRGTQVHFTLPTDAVSPNTPPCVREG